MTLHQWGIYETQLTASANHANPFWDVTAQVTFTAPSGRQQTIDAYWNGGATWGVRFSPDEVGGWTWTTTCAEDPGLDGQTGAFACHAYEGDNPLYRHGALRVAADRRYLQHTDGTPFFWLGDTAWNGVLQANPDDWQTYLQARREQGFNVIQYVSTQWRGCMDQLKGAPAFTGTERIRLNPDFFQQRDDKVAAINAAGMIAAPIMLWTLTEIDPGQTLAEADAVRLIRYLMARWGAYQVVWLAGGDGCYEGDLLTRWKRIGRAAFTGEQSRLVTMHPCGQSWPSLRGEPWLDFIGYQSGHGDSDEHLRWLTEGPPAADWDTQPRMPIINLEPNYEIHPTYHSKRVCTDYEVRRASYWSLLVAPTAGVTFGHNAIWVWRDDTGPAENHQNLPEVPPWSAGVETPGIASMGILGRFFADLPWWTLRPAPDLVAEQPADPKAFIAAARSVDGTLAVIYTPVGGDLPLTLDGPARWFNPRTGEYTQATSLTTPDSGDWLLVVG